MTGTLFILCIWNNSYEKVVKEITRWPENHFYDMIIEKNQNVSANNCCVQFSRYFPHQVLRPLSIKITYISCPLNSCWRWGMYMFVKSTFEMPTVRGQQHSISTHEQLLFRSCGSFRDLTCPDSGGIWYHNLRIHAKWSAIWATRARNLLSHLLWYWPWW